MVASQLRMEMQRSDYDTWVQGAQAAELQRRRLPAGRGQRLRARLGRKPPAHTHHPAAGEHLQPEPQPARGSAQRRRAPRT